MDQSHPIAPDLTSRLWPGGYLRCRETETERVIAQALAATVAVR